MQSCCAKNKAADCSENSVLKIKTEYAVLIFSFLLEDYISGFPPPKGFCWDCFGLLSLLMAGGCHGLGQPARECSMAAW